MLTIVTLCCLRNNKRSDILICSLLYPGIRNRWIGRDRGVEKVVEVTAHRERPGTKKRLCQSLLLLFLLLIVWMLVFVLIMLICSLPCPLPYSFLFFQRLCQHLLLLSHCSPSPPTDNGTKTLHFMGIVYKLRIVACQQSEGPEGGLPLWLHFTSKLLSHFKCPKLLLT